MKKAMSFCLTLLTLTVILSGCLPEGKINPKKAPDKAAFTELFEQDGTTYGYNIVYNGDYTKLSPEEQKKLVKTELIEQTYYKTEIIYKCEGVVHYKAVAPSEKTGSCIYFYTEDGKNSYSVYSYNTRSGMFRPLSAAPGSMLVIPDGDYGFGWIAKDATLYAVDLDEGVIDNEKTYNLENSELLFYEDGQDFEKKITKLYPGTSDTVICLDVQYYSEEQGDIPRRSYTYLFNTFTGDFLGPFESFLFN